MNNTRVREEFESNPKMINPNGVYRAMIDAQSFPLADSDFERIARSFGLGVGTMRAFMKQHGLLERLEEHYMGKIDHDEAMRLYSQGMSDAEVARRLGTVTPNAVSKWRQAHGLVANRDRANALGQTGPTWNEAHSTPPPDCGSSVQWAKVPSGLKPQNSNALLAATLTPDSTKTLQRQLLFLRGVAIGAGVRDIDKLLAEVVQ